MPLNCLYLLLHFIFICYCFLRLFAVRIWDVRPFAPKERCVKIFQGNVHNFEKVICII